MRLPDLTRRKECTETSVLKRESTKNRTKKMSHVKTTTENTNKNSEIAGNWCFTAIQAKAPGKRETQRKTRKTQTTNPKTGMVGVVVGHPKPANYQNKSPPQTNRKNQTKTLKTKKQKTTYKKNKSKRNTHTHTLSWKWSLAVFKQATPQHKER